MSSKEYFSLLSHKNNLIEFQHYINYNSASFLFQNIQTQNPFEILIKKNQLEKYKILLEIIPLELFEVNSIPPTEITNMNQLLEKILINNLITNNTNFNRILLNCIHQLEKKKPEYLDLLLLKIENEATSNLENIYKHLYYIIFYKNNNLNTLKRIIENPHYNLINYIKSNQFLIESFLLKCSVITDIDFLKYYKTILNQIGIRNEDILIYFFLMKKHKLYTFKRGSLTISNLIQCLKPLDLNYKTNLFIFGTEYRISSVLIFLGFNKIIKEISYDFIPENLENDLISIFSNYNLSEDWINEFRPILEIYRTNECTFVNPKLPKYLKQIKKLISPKLKDFLIETINKSTNKTEYINLLLEVLN